MLGILRNSKFGNSVQTSKNYTEAKRGVTNLVFMDLNNPFSVSGDVTGYINMHNTHLFTFGHTKLQYMSATAKITAKRKLMSITITEHLVQRKEYQMRMPLGYMKILQQPNLKFLEDKKSWVGRTVMSPF